MQMPEEVQAMLKLASLGWGAKRISRELGCSRNTVRSYLRQGSWQPTRRPGGLAPRVLGPDGSFPARPGTGGIGQQQSTGTRLKSLPHGAFALKSQMRP